MSLLRAERAGARSAEETGADASSGASGAGQALRYAGGSAPARRPTPTDSAISKWWTHDSDICIWWTHDMTRQPPDPRSSLLGHLQRHPPVFSANCRRLRQWIQEYLQL